MVVAVTRTDPSIWAARILPRLHRDRRAARALGVGAVTARCGILVPASLCLPAPLPSQHHQAQPKGRRYVLQRDAIDRREKWVKIGTANLRFAARDG